MCVQIVSVVTKSVRVKMYANRGLSVMNMIGSLGERLPRPVIAGQDAL